MPDPTTGSTGAIGGRPSAPSGGGTRAGGGRSEQEVHQMPDFDTQRQGGTSERGGAGRSQFERGDVRGGPQAMQSGHRDDGDPRGGHRSRRVEERTMGGAQGTQREHDEVDWDERASTHGRGRDVNVGQTERLVSGVLGGTLAGLGLKQGSLLGVAVAALGGALLYRGVSGRCPIYAHYGLDTTQGYDQLASRLGCRHEGGHAQHAKDEASEASLDDALKATFPASDPATSY